MRRSVGLFALLAAGCVAPDPGSPSPDRPTNEDPAPRWGQPSTLPEWFGRSRPARVPTRVVSLAPGLTETLFALGSGAAVVGTSRFADHPEEATRLPKVGGYTDLDVEAVLTLRPDLVVGVPGDAYRAQLEVLDKSSVPVRVLPASSIADALATIHDLGALLGREAEAATLSNTMQASLLASANLAKDRPKVAMVYGWRPLFLAGPSSFPDELLQLIGARNAAEKGGAWAQWSYEGLLATGAEVVIDAAGGGPPEQLAELPAVRTHRVFRAPDARLLRPGPRLGEAAAELARLLTTTATRAQAEAAPGIDPPP